MSTPEPGPPAWPGAAPHAPRPSDAGAPTTSIPATGTGAPQGGAPSPYAAPQGGASAPFAAPHGGAPAPFAAPQGGAPSPFAAPQGGAPALSPHAAPRAGSPAPAPYTAPHPGFAAPPPYAAPHPRPPASPYAAAVAGPYAPAWAPSAPAPTDPLAVASLVTSCAGVLGFVSAPVGLGLGIAAQRRIRRTGAQGLGLAVAGTWVGGVLTGLLALWLGLVAVPTLLAATTEEAVGSPVADSWPAPGDDAAAGGSGLPWFELTDTLVPGDCLAAVPETYDLSDVLVVDCGSVHEAEVVDLLFMDEPVRSDVEHPDAAYDDLLGRCAAVVERLVDPATLPADAWGDVYFAHPEQWAAGEKRAYCVLAVPAATGSVRTGTYAPPAGAEL